jgi:hypothetical protein
MTAENLTPVFVHRESELSQVWDRLTALRVGKTITEPVLFFHGVTMVGKSALLRKIKQKSAKNLMPVALINFADGYAGSFGKGRLAREVLKQWEVSTEISPFEPILSDDDDKEAAKKLVMYAQQLNHSARSNAVVLLLDTIEAIERETFAWLQLLIMEPILEGEKALVTLAARAEYMELPVELSWPIARRTRFIVVRPFKPEETRDHYKALIGNESPTEWHKRLLEVPNWLTLGVPGLNEIAFQNPFEKEEDGLRYMVEEIIFKRIAEGNIQQVRHLLLIMAVFRKFDYRLLAQVSNHFWPEKYPETNRGAGVVLARQMKTTMLLEARQDGYGYVIAPDLRRLLDDYERYHEKLRHFETHCLAYDWFQEEVEKGDFVSIIDQMYHLIGAWFDLQQDKAKELRYPKNMPSQDKGRLKVLLEIAERGMERITDKSKADIQVEKVLNVLQHETREFLRFLTHDEMTAVTNHLKESLDEAVQLADKQDRKTR